MASEQSEKMRLPPIGFWSYARRDDEGLFAKEVTGLHAQVSAALQQQFGREDITIFQDTAEIHHGKAWESEIRRAIDRSTFFIPIITPNFLQSEWCCREVAMFLERQDNLFEQYPDLPREDRIFPILFVDVQRTTPVDPAIARKLKALQWFDFSKLRYETGAAPRKAIAEFTGSICDLLMTTVSKPLTADELVKLKAAKEAHAAAERVRAEQAAQKKADAERQQRDAGAAAAAAATQRAEAERETRVRAGADAKAQAEQARQRAEKAREETELAAIEEGKREKTERLASRAAFRAQLSGKGPSIALCGGLIFLIVAALIALVSFSSPGPMSIVPLHTSDTTDASPSNTARPAPAAEPAPIPVPDHGWLLGKKWGVFGDCASNWLVVELNATTMSVRTAGNPKPYIYKVDPSDPEKLIATGQIAFVKNGNRVAVTYPETDPQELIICHDGK